MKVLMIKVIEYITMHVGAVIVIALVLILFQAACLLTIALLGLF